MHRLDFKETELLRVLRVNKTAISLLEKPQVLLNQLRDCNLIPEDQYRLISRMKKRENVVKKLYELLEWVETNRKNHIVLFWNCAFEPSIMNQYPKLQTLYQSLMDGSFRDTVLPERLESKTSDQGNSSEGDEQGGGVKRSVKKKRKQSGESVEDGEQPGPSGPQTPAQRSKKRKISYFSPVKKGQENKIWEWAIYKSLLPVTCGDKEGMLSRARLADGEKCVWVDEKWLSPGEFEKFAGKAHNKNWKLSVRCGSTVLQKLIQEGHLKVKSGRRRRLEDRNSSATTDTDRDEDTDESDRDDRSSAASAAENKQDEVVEQAEQEEPEEPEEQEEQEEQTGVFKVTCGRLEGNLHMVRFATGTRGKSIRTEDRWLTPTEFLEKGLGRSDTQWRKDIECDGRPLDDLIKLKIHSLLCRCHQCKPSAADLKNQENDDNCSLCESTAKTLVQCDDCPRSFHARCHLPHLDDLLCQKKEDTPWLCTFCVYRRNLDFYTHKELTMDAAKAINMSQHLMECQYLFMRLRCADRLRTLAANPTPAPPGCAVPVSPGSVAERLQRGSHKTVGEFVAEMQHIFEELENSEGLTETTRLRELFEQDFRNVFNISS